MSRRRGEFEHRTSIFEGAFRAWSHLGGLDPVDLERKPAADLDPLTSPLENDRRLESSKRNGSSSPRNRREYPYEPLPRTGLAHPYVQAILSPWLGPDADNEAIQLGLTTLRTWWQHRRKGESGSAIAALGTEKMKGVVEGYTRHFFTLAHCLIVNDREQAPRTLQGKMKDLQKTRSKKNKKRAREEEAERMTALALKGGLDEGMAAGINQDLTDASLSPLERLHAAQRRQLQESGGIHPSTGTATTSGGIPGTAPDTTSTPLIDVRGKCVPGKIDLPGLADTVSRHAAQLSHHGSGSGGGGTKAAPATVPSSPAPSASAVDPSPMQYGNPNTFPVVFVGRNGDAMIAMKVDGITCAHCVKIVETVLRGCSGNRSPIDGLLDAAADRGLNGILIRIDRPGNAKRIAFESARNLAMVGYTARAIEMDVAAPDGKRTLDPGALGTAFEVLANTESGRDLFNWILPCTCPDNGVSRNDCSRHSQMHDGIYDAFDTRRRQVMELLRENGTKFTQAKQDDRPARETLEDPSLIRNQMHEFQGGSPFDGHPQAFDDQPLRVEQPMELFGMEPPNGVGPPTSVSLNANAPALPSAAPIPLAVHHPQQQQQQHGSVRGTLPHDDDQAMPLHVAAQQRNMSVISFGNLNMRHMSVTSEATFGRAMSGLSALSIDWENMGDFDVEVDHSAGINEHLHHHGGVSNTADAAAGGENKVEGTSADTYVKVK